MVVSTRFISWHTTNAGIDRSIVLPAMDSILHISKLKSCCIILSQCLMNLIMWCGTTVASECRWKSSLSECRWRKSAAAKSKRGWWKPSCALNEKSRADPGKKGRFSEKVRKFLINSSYLLLSESNLIKLKSTTKVRSGTKRCAGIKCALWTPYSRLTRTAQYSALSTQLSSIHRHRWRGFCLKSGWIQ